ncbi:MAG: polysaccharide export protein [Candidatus Omnitrophica bacterium]|nr:polysaccharide export protein [Candidatus Omnitrophota bacterium]
MKSTKQLRWIAGTALVIFILLGSRVAPAQDASTKVDTNVVSTTDHKIAPLEIITVEVFGEKDLSKEFRVSASGKISFPMLGEIEVAGKTAAQVENKIKELLSKDLLVDPQVTVAVKEYRMRNVIVMGEVNRPGAVQLQGEQKWTILDAIGEAGGLTRAAKNAIEFTRQGHTKRLNLEELKKENDPNKIIYLEPGDMIYVPQTFW